MFNAYESTKLRWYNWALIGTTYLFHLLHLVQTHTTYDATAKDVIIQSSQASVIMMLVFVICLGNFSLPVRVSPLRVLLTLKFSLRVFCFDFLNFGPKNHEKSNINCSRKLPYTV